MSLKPGSWHLNIDTISQKNFNEFDLANKQYKFTAKCSSYICTLKDEHGFVIKEVARSVTFCPDCGSALFWEREDRCLSQ